MRGSNKELCPRNAGIRAAPGWDKVETFPVSEMPEKLPERFQKCFYGMFKFFLKNPNSSQSSPAPSQIQNS